MLWHFRKRPVALDIIVAVAFTVVVIVGVNFAVRTYVLKRAEQNVENLILSHRGLHHYIQRVMHPTFYAAVAAGSIASDYYAPEIFSSSYIVRVMHGFYNEELLKHEREGIYYKLAAENPRNPVNKADAYELNLINLFNGDRQLSHFSEIVTVGGKQYLYYAIPFLENTQACLNCHGRPEDSPRGLRTRYGGDGGFYEKVGHIRAIESIRAPIKDELGFVGTSLVVVGGAALSMMGLFLFGKRMQAEVRLQTGRLHEELAVRKKAEDELRLRGAALQAAANSVVITDREGRIEWVNPAFTALSGWSLAEAIGRNPRELVKSGDHDAAFYRKMWDTILAGDVWRGEIINRRRSGEKWTEEMTITPLRDAQGVITHFIAIKQDITARKNMEAQLLQAQRMEAVGTLASGIAHDLNNILAPVLMVSGLLKEKLTATEDREMLAMLQREAQRGGDIIKQLLAYSRGLEGRRMVLQPRYVLHEILAMMRETFPREIRFRQQLPADLWPIVADQTQLQQVMLNLCVNARDAMPRGGDLTVVAANVTWGEGDAARPPGMPPGAYLLIEVRDTGHGIAPEIRHRIFDPFFTTKPLGKGTGLGLSTVLGIVRKHGGFLLVDSTPGQGSVFKVYLPAAPTEKPSPTAEIAEAAAPGGGEWVLVVDDEHNIREATRIALQQQGYRVHTAGNGEEALACYRAHRDSISLVLTDVMMPVMNGIALIRALRDATPELPIIATTGLDDADKREELTALGVTEILRKPCSVASLLAVVQRQLKRP